MKTALLIGLFILLTACVQVEEKPVEKVKVGFIVALTGPTTSCGLNMRIGLETAQNLTDVSHIDFIIEDDQFDPKKSVIAAEKLINVD